MTGRRALGEAREARRQNRLLCACAAAAVLAAIGVQLVVERAGAGGDDATASIEDSTRFALIRRATAHTLTFEGK